MGRLGVDALRVLTAAGELARGYRHESVEPEHLLCALLAERRMEPVLAKLAIDHRVLTERIKGHLAGWPASGLYRDARNEPTAGERLRILLDRAGARRIVSLVWPITIEQLGRAACALPSLISLVMEARSEIVTATDAVAHARMLAIARGDARLSVFHLTHALADQVWLGTALRHAGLDPEALQTALAARMSTASAHDMLAADNEKVGSRDKLLARLLRTPQIEALFSALGVPVYRVFRDLVDSSGDSLDDASLPDDDGAEVEIIFHNDDFTTMEFVMDTLGYCFDVTPAAAAKLMHDIHANGGPEVVAVLPAGEARKRVEKSRAHARRAGMPLRITWRRRNTPT